MMKSRHRRPLISLILLVIFFITINIFSGLSLRMARLDFTAQSLYTLSAGTHNILANLSEPVTLEFYYSRAQASDYPALQLYASRVRDMLEEIAAAAKGNVKLEIIDPAPFSEIEEVAVSKGLVGQSTPVNELIYFGLIGTNMVDSVEIIPFFAPEREQYLEYDIIRLIANLDMPEKPVLGVLSNLPLDTGTGGLLAAMQGQSQPFLIYSELIDRFRVEFLTAKTDAIPKDINILLIAHPRPLSDALALAIDQFVMRGGRVIAFLDPHSEVSLTAGAGGNPLPGHTEQSAMPQLLAAWGVDMAGNKIVADRTRAQKVFVGHNARQQLADYILWMGLEADEMNAHDLVTANIDLLNIGTPGSLAIRSDATAQITPLVTSSDDAMLVPREEVLAAPRPEDLLAQFTPDNIKHIIAARISGTVKTAFPDNAQADHVAMTENANIIIFADSDFFDDRFWVSEQTYLGQRFGVPIADNGKFLLNAVENFMGSNDLISLRGREPIARPFTRVEELRRKAEDLYLAEQQSLRVRIETAEAELDNIERLGGAQSQTKQAAQNYRNELVQARRALRAVEANLHRDIDQLGRYVRWVNILSVPLLLLGLATFIAMRRARKRLATQKRGGMRVRQST